MTLSVLKFSSLPNVTGNVIYRVPSPEVQHREEIRFKPAPPSTSILVTLRLRIVGETNISKHPTAVMRSGWSAISKMIGVLDHFRGLRDSTGGSAALTSRTHCLS